MGARSSSAVGLRPGENLRGDGDVLDAPFEPRIALCAAGEIWGGVEQFIVTVSDELRRRGVPFVVLLHHDALLASRLRESSLPVEVIPSAGKYDPSAILRLRRVFRRHRINVVHVNGYRASIVAGISAKLTGIRLVKTEHGRLEPFHGAAKLKMNANIWLDNFLSKRILDAVAFVSRDIQGALSARYPGVRQTVIYNAIHPAPAHAAGTAVVLPRPEGPAFRLGIVGRLKPIKGHEVLIRAMARLRRADLVLYVFGEGETELSCRRLCQEAGIDGRVHFMGFQADMQAHMRQLDAIVMPSFHEGIPYTALEAMDLGIPLIASDVGGLREILTHEDDALLVPPGDEAALASAIERMADDSSLRERLRMNARRTVAARFGAARMVDQYLDLYQADSCRL